MIQFTKMHGLGNDFIVINTMQQTVPDTKNFIAEIANRHTGVGCDQVLMVGFTEHPHADFNYRIFNPDGTEVYQCGNGARCVGLFVREKKLSDKKTIILETKRETMKVTCIDDQHVVVDIAIPNFDPQSLPFLPAFLSIPYQFHTVSVGNPHCIIEDCGLSTDAMEKMGQELNSHPAFPEGINLGFVKIISPNEIHLRVYERGAGLTQACGSGACAAVAVLRKQKKVDAITTVHQPGGRLTVTWNMPTDFIQLTGPAVRVFDGEYGYLLS